jgi:hypothetical protein
MVTFSVGIESFSSSHIRISDLCFSHFLFLYIIIILIFISLEKFVESYQGNSFFVLSNLSYIFVREKLIEPSIWSPFNKYKWTLSEWCYYIFFLQIESNMDQKINGISMSKRILKKIDCSLTTHKIDKVELNPVSVNEKITNMTFQISRTRKTKLEDIKYKCGFFLIFHFPSSF